MKRFIYFLLVFCLAAMPVSADSSRIQCQLLSRLQVDAVVDCPDESAFPSPVIVKTLGVDFDRTLDVLGLEGSPAFTQHFSADHGFDEIYGDNNIHVYDDGSYISVCNRFLRFWSGAIQPVKWVCAYEYALTEQARTGPDLSFCSRAQADAAVRELIAELGLGSWGDALALEACYALPCEDLKLAYDKKLSFQRTNHLLERNPPPSKDTWTHDDDCYYLSYTWQAAGLSANTEPYRSLEDASTFPGSTLEAIFTPRGVEMLAAEGLIQVESMDSPQTVISAQDALELFRKKYENIILMEDQLVDRIQLSYLTLAAPDGSPRQHLVPVWRLHIFDPYSSPDYTNSDEWTTFDAITGQEM